MQAFLRIVIYNWLIAGTDAHAKNFSIVHAPGRAFRLAPLYDVNSYLPYGELRPERMSMRIGGEAGFDVYPRHWEALAGDCRVEASWLLSEVRLMAEQLPDAVSAVVQRCVADGLNHPVFDVLSRMIGSRCREMAARYSAF